MKTKLLLMCVLAVPLSVFAVDGVVAIGALEEGDVPPGYQHQLRSGVRLLFEKTDAGWKTICKSHSVNRNDDCNFARVDDSVDWFIQDKGTQVGTIKTKGWLDSNYYSETGLLKIISDTVPHVGERSINFSGWMGLAVYRPLVAMTKSPQKSSHKWDRVKPEPHDVNLIWPLFSHTLPKVEVCLVDKEGNPNGVNYRPSRKKDVVMHSVWKSSEGGRLLHAGINNEVFKNCDGPLESQIDVWFYQPPVGELQVLPGQSGASIGPLDFGDFGGNGSDEAIFFLTGYNEGGYVLFYDHFQKQVRFTWGYH